MIRVPQGKMLLPFQEKGVNSILGLLEKRKGALLADEMGLGKTIQAIAIINSLAYNFHMRVLVVCPLSLVNNWLEELSNWRDGLSRVTVINYEGVSKIDKSVELDLLVIDEAHWIKNPETKRAKQIQKIRAKKILLLTGTPIDSRPLDIWQLLLLIDRDYWAPPVKIQERKQLPSSVVLTSSRKKEDKKKIDPYLMRFARRYCGAKMVPHGIKLKNGKPIFREGKPMVRTHWDFSGATNLEELGSILKERSMVRRLKSEVLTELPPKRRQLILFPSSRVDNRFLADLNYNNYEECIRKLTADKIKFEEFSRVRHEQALEKIPQVVECVKNLLEQTHKLVLFAHHTDVILRLADELAGDYKTTVLIGLTEVDDRNDAIQEFQNNPKCRLFIGSIRAAGVGITLTEASVCAFAELDPSPSVMNQCEDRLHRITQKNAVLVYHLLVNGSIDARIAKILIRKQANITKAIG